MNELLQLLLSDVATRRKELMLIAKTAGAAFIGGAADAILRSLDAGAIIPFREMFHSAVSGGLIAVCFYVKKRPAEIRAANAKGPGE
jgi:hypothetical protein